MKRLSRKTFQNQNGFTLLELLIVMAIIMMLAALFLPNLQAAVANARASQAASLWDSVRSASQLLNSQTNNDPIWEGTTEWWGTGAGNHVLSENPGWAGWAGPYIEKPFTISDNPWKSGMALSWGSWWWGTGNPGNGWTFDNGMTFVPDSPALHIWGLPQTPDWTILNMGIDGTSDSNNPNVFGKVIWPCGGCTQMFIKTP